MEIVLLVPILLKLNHCFHTKKCGFKFKKEKMHDNGAKSFVFEKKIDML